MNDNTVLRIKVPAHLYESVKEQLTLKEAKAKPHYGAGMEVVKEKKAKPVKDGMHKVEEVKEKEDVKPERSLEELKKAHKAIEKKINEMEGADKKEEIKEFVGINPQDYDWITALGLSLPAIVAMLRLGADKLGSEVYAKLQKAKEYLEKKGSQDSEEPMGEAKDEEKKEEE